MRATPGAESADATRRNLRNVEQHILSPWARFLSGPLMFADKTRTRERENATLVRPPAPSPCRLRLGGAGEPRCCPWSPPPRAPVAAHQRDDPPRYTDLPPARLLPHRACGTARP